MTGVPGEAIAGGRQPRSPHAVPLSFSQEGLWAIDRLSESSMLAVAMAYVVPESISLDTITSAIDAVTARHDILGSRILSDACGPYAVVDSTLRPIVRREAISAAGDAFRQAVAKRVSEESRAPFDLARAPPCRWTLYRADDGQTIAAIFVHHIATDLWSMQMLAGEIDQALSGGSPPQPAGADNAIPYWTHAARERAAYRHGQWDRDLAFWRGFLAAVPARMPLPPVAEGEASPELVLSITLVIPGRIVTRATARAEKFGCTPSMMFMACVGRAISRWLDLSTVVISTPTAARYARDTTRTFGLFANRLIVPLSFPPHLTGSAWLGECRRQFIRAYVHGHVPYPLIVSEVNPPRGFGGTGPWSQVSCQLFQTIRGTAGEPAVLSQFSLPARPSVVYDVNVESRMAEDGLHVALHHRRDKLSRTDAAQLRDDIYASYEEIADRSL